MYDSPLEDVHTVDDWYDGPRSGFAQYNGVPHHYRSVYLDHNEWNPDEDRFELVPVSLTLLAAGIEADAIFRRWDAERQSGNLAWESSDSEAEFGALPVERERRSSGPVAARQCGCPRSCACPGQRC